MEENKKIENLEKKVNELKKELDLKQDRIPPRRRYILLIIIGIIIISFYIYYFSYISSFYK